jgi:hypothetical protein
LGQAAFAWHARNVDPKRDYLAPPPSRTEWAALSFGDEQFLYRVFALDVQDAGDTGGRIVPVKNYDFARVIGWFDTLAEMDPRSDFAIGMAGGFFGLSQNVRDVEPIVRFMLRDTDANPPQRWRFLFDAIYLARHRLKNNALALEVAYKLAGYDFPGLDPWATLMPAFILEDEHRYGEARAVVETTIRRFDGRMTPKDTSWTASYLSFLSKVERGEVPPRKQAWE